jgi:hypothetical protein
MSQLTIDERRRVFLAQQQSRRLVFAPPPAAPGVDRRGERGGRRAPIVPGLLTLVVLGAALAAGSVAWRGVEFHPPTSLLDAVLPRA